MTMKLLVNFANVPVKLLNTSSAVVAMTLIDSSGNYMFYNLPIGSYSVMETDLAGFLDVSDIDGSDAIIVAVTLGLGSS
jgi:hypothetical protein